MALLTADDVLTVKFQTSSFKEGYDQDEVDVLLDDVTTTMRTLEAQLSGQPQSPSHRFTKIFVTSSDVRNTRLGTTRWSGYNVGEVDAFLDQVAASMEALENRLATGSGGAQAYGTGGYGAPASDYGVAESSAPVTGTSIPGTSAAPGVTGAPGDSQYADAIAQRDRYIAQLQEENAYLRAELESAQRRLGTSGL